MARPRDYKAEHARRQASAKARGFESAYQQRVAGVPRGERATVRGHGLPSGFLRSLSSGDQIILADPISSIELYTGFRWVTVNGVRKRQPVERYRLIRKLVIYARTGRERRWNLRRLTRAELRSTIRKEEAKGVVFSPAPSRDQRRLVSEQ